MRLVRLKHVDNHEPASKFVGAMVRSRLPVHMRRTSLAQLAYTRRYIIQKETEI
jgi:hypothetical protein